MNRDIKNTNDKLKGEKLEKVEKDINGEKKEKKELKELKELKNEKVVALKYQKGYNAPKVIAKGTGRIAEKILGIAEENDITVHTDENLAENLSALELGSDIPPELFEVVAQIYAFIGKIESILENTNNPAALTRKDL